MASSLDDYIIDHSDIDWAKILKDWRWLLPSCLTVWIMNRFGDLFVVLEDGTIHILDVGGGTFRQIAHDRDEFAERLDEGDNANQWLMIPLVDKLVAANVLLTGGQCYGYRIPPVLGGQYTVDNSAVISIAEHFGFHAGIHQQTKHLPDGAKVVLKITDD